VVGPQDLDSGERITLTYLTFEDFIDLMVQGKINGDHPLREWLLAQYYLDG